MDGSSWIAGNAGVLCLSPVIWLLSVCHRKLCADGWVLRQLPHRKILDIDFTTLHEKKGGANHHLFSEFLPPLQEEASWLGHFHVQELILRPFSENSESYHKSDVHPNLVALLGYCEHKDHCFLFYELCPNGNLLEWHFGNDKVLSWISRLKIAIDSARGLWFLHTYPRYQANKHTSRCKLRSKAFRLWFAIPIAFGYVDPEYQKNSRFNPASDVYSFGVVLLQIISGRKVINMNMNTPMPIDKMVGNILGRYSDLMEGFNEFIDRAEKSGKDGLACVLSTTVTTEHWGRSRNSYDGNIVERSKSKKIKVGS